MKEFVAFIVGWLLGVALIYLVLYLAVAFVVFDLSWMQQVSDDAAAFFRLMMVFVWAAWTAIFSSVWAQAR